jgi:outer membrane protein assembly factor BamB
MSFSRQVRHSWLPWLLLLPAALLLTACGAAGQSGPVSWPSVSTDGTTAYVASGPQVYAVDVETHKLKWSYPVEPSRDVSFFAAPGIADDGIVYIGSYDKSVRALDAESGEQLDAFTELDGRVIGSPVVAGDRLLVPTDGGSLYALERSSLDEEWRFQAETDTCRPPSEGRKEPSCSIWSAPLVDGGSVYVATISHVLYGIDLESGRELWKAPMAAAIADTPALDDGVLLTGVLGNSLVLIGADDGQELWTQPTSGWLWGSPVVADGIAYFGDTTPTVWTTKDGEGNVYAFDLAAQEVVWQKAKTAATTTSVIADDTLIVALRTVSSSLRPSGNEIWRQAALARSRPTRSCRARLSSR